VTPIDSRPFKIAAIKAPIEFCEAERRHLLKMVTSCQVDLAWISERMDSIENDLRHLHHDSEEREKLVANEWN
jgi:hypothetical protein